jgi:hypothetical protein
MKNKVQIKMTKELVAPCGMNCALCITYLAMKYDAKPKGVKVPYCKGCRPRGKMCAFIKKKCTLLKKDNNISCYQCKKFPCKNLKHLDDKYKIKYKTSLIENNQSIKKVGMEKFLKAQAKKSRCPRCGGTLSVHNNACFVCDLDWIKKNTWKCLKEDVKKKN